MITGPYKPLTERELNELARLGASEHDLKHRAIGAMQLEKSKDYQQNLKHQVLMLQDLEDAIERQDLPQVHRLAPLINWSEYFVSNQLRREGETKLTHVLLKVLENNQAPIVKMNENTLETFLAENPYKKQSNEFVGRALESLLKQGYRLLDDEPEVLFTTNPDLLLSLESKGTPLFTSFLKNHQNQRLLHVVMETGMMLDWDIDEQQTLLAHCMDEFDKVDQDGNTPLHSLWQPHPLKDGKEELMFKTYKMMLDMITPNSSVLTQLVNMKGETVEQLVPLEWRQRQDVMVHLDEAEVEIKQIDKNLLKDFQINQADTNQNTTKPFRRIRL